ncbi:MAG TPA: sodium pump decarboxylase subunit gamma [Treponema sp.]|nr:sodium pump decarboxylase subunit gamma [Treponema sp.]
MTIMEMLGQSGVLTLLGMGIVFGFLVLLIIAITILGKVFHILGIDNDVKAPVAAAPKTAGNSAEITAAISAAVNEHRKKG